MSTINLYTRPGAPTILIAESDGRWYQMLVTLNPVDVWWAGQREIAPPPAGYVDLIPESSARLIRGPLARLIEAAGK